jgi:hypothetical protein
VLLLLCQCVYSPKTQSAGKDTEKPTSLFSSVSCRPNLPTFFLFYFISFVFSTVAAVAANDQLMSVREPNGTSNGHKKKEKFNTTSLLCALGLVLLLLSLFGFAA